MTQILINKCNTFVYKPQLSYKKRVDASRRQTDELKESCKSGNREVLSF